MLGRAIEMICSKYCKVSYKSTNPGDWLLTGYSGGLDEKERSGYTYISFAYGEKGPAVTICCAPKFVSS